jgi:hypothetical protein
MNKQIINTFLLLILQAYTVLIHPANGTGILGESPPKSAVLERRYTDFLNLHSAIKQISDSLPPFPRKCLLGK